MVPKFFKNNKGKKKHCSLLSLPETSDGVLYKELKVEKRPVLWVAMDVFFDAEKVDTHKQGGPHAQLLTKS